MAKATLAIDIVADARRAQAGFNQAAGGVQRLRTAMSAAVTTFGVTRALGAMVGLARGSIQAASDLNETLNKTGVVFGQQTAAVEAWSRSSVQAMGLSQRAALEAASGFGLMFQQLGFASGKAVSMSETLTQLSGDIASFYNLPVSDVIQALSSAFRGEYDALQRFVPSITAARIQSEAMAATGKKSATALTDQEKAATAYKIILDQTRKAQGDFVRTSSSVANQQRMATAAWEQAQATLGQKLQPVMTRILRVLSGLVTWMTQHTTAVYAMAGALGVFATAMLVASAATFAMEVVASPLVLAIAGIAAAVAALVVGIVLLYQRSQTFRDIVQGAFDGIVTAAKAVYQFFTRTLAPVWEMLAQKAMAFWAIVQPVFAALGGVLSAVGSAIVSALAPAFRILGVVAQAVFPVIIAYYKLVWAVIQLVWSIMSAVLIPVFKLLAVVAVPILKLIATNFRLLGAAIQAVWNWVSPILIPAIRLLGTVATTVLNNATSNVDRMRGAVDWAGRAVRDVIEWIRKVTGGPFDNVRVAVDAVRGALDWAGRAVQDFIGLLDKIHLPGGIRWDTFLPGRALLPGGPSPVPAAGRALPTVSQAAVGIMPRAAVTTPRLIATVRVMPTTVRVYLGEAELTKFVRRVVVDQLDAEGARLASGAWA